MRPSTFAGAEIIHTETTLLALAAMSPTWPLEVLNTMTLSEHDGRTTLTIRGAPINAADEERKTFQAGRESMKHGFTGTFDQLADHLAKG